MPDRKKAIDELKRQIEAQKARLDPKLLEMAGKAAALSQRDPAKKDMVPYDREAAAAVVRLFLQNHGDRQKFEQRLSALLKKE